MSNPPPSQPLDAQLGSLNLSSNNPFAQQPGYPSSGATGATGLNASAYGYPAPGQSSTSGAAPGSSGSFYPAVPGPAPGPPQTYAGMYTTAPGAAPGAAPAGYGSAPPGYYAPPSDAPTAPPAEGYGAPPAAQGYGASPPATQGYGAPPAAQGYGAPPPATQGYNAPPAGAQGYGAPPAAGVGSPAVPGAPDIGAGWTPESVQPAHAAPGQYGHYGHLQYAPSFNTASAADQAAAAAAAAATGGSSSVASSIVMPQALPGNQWVLQGKLQQPQSQIIGPHVRFNDFDPVTGAYAVSVLVVAHPSLASSTVQLHYGVDAPAAQSAPGQVLDDFMGFKFWRFDIRLQLSEQPGVCNYLVGLVGGQAPLASHSFCLPARNEPWRWVFYSCNGFHADAPEVTYGGIGHLWGDVMRRHSQMRYHLQVGGGDQLYCDRLFKLPTLKPWLSISEHQVRSKEPFTPAMLQEAEQFYFGSYAQHFSDTAFAPALASIPFTFSWDDHDIFDGWGSYPDYLQKSAVFQGLFAVARRFYLLFQQHCRYDNAVSISNTMGEYSYHQVRSIGPNVVLVSPDTRSERSIHQVVPPKAWDMLLAEAARRIAARPGAIQHLLVLLPVPIVYPKIPVTESIMASLAGGMASNKSMRETLAKLTGGEGGAVNVFGEPDILDDLLDHWTATDHVQERQMLVRRLQELANTYSVRVTFLSGDVHVGAFGCFQAHPKQHLRVIDPKFMMQVISSAIGNEPPPGGVVGALETSSMASTAMGDTLDKMIRAFPNGKKLRPARNYAEVVPLLSQHTCQATGAMQPPGGLAFTLRVEQGPPGQPSGVETFTQVAPVLLAGPRAAEASHYASGQTHVKASASGVMSQIGSMLPGESGQQLQQGVKTMGHKLANFLARV